MIALILFLCAGLLFTITRTRALDLRLRGGIASAGSLALLLYFSYTWMGSENHIWTWQMDWLPQVGIQLALRADGLSALFALIVLGIGTVIFAYTGVYLKGARRSGHMLSLLLLFELAMLGVVLSDDVITLFICWELTSVISFLLISADYEKPSARFAGRHALLITGIGGLCLMGGLLIAAATFDTWKISEMQQAAALAGGLPTKAWVLILLGALTKSAIFPFHSWLPLAMAAPTPVSAYLHSATMVKAGVFLLLRLFPVLVLHAWWAPTLLTLGTITLLYAGYRALRVSDLKQVLAWTTIAALGTIVVALGTGTTAGVIAALVFIIVHALYKSSLFMLAGAIDKLTGTRELDSLAGLRRYMPFGALAGLLAGLSMAGIPPFVGFVGKELIYQAQLEAPGVSILIPVLAILGNALALVAAVLVGIEPFRNRKIEKERRHTTSTKVALLSIFALIPALFSLLFGLLSNILIAPILSDTMRHSFALSEDVQLGLWHGFNTALILSIITVAGGAALAAWRIRKADSWLSPSWTPKDGAAWLFETLPTFATFVIRPFKRASIVGWIGSTVIMVYVILVGTNIHAGLQMPALSLQDFDSFQTLVLFLVLIGMAITIAARHPLTAIGGMGFIGSALAVWFLHRGAPDVGATQLLVEALSLLVLAWAWLRVTNTYKPNVLPPSLRRQHYTSRIFISLAMGGGLTAILLLGGPWTPPTELGLDMIQRTQPEAFGLNVVNVILVDFRLFDTLGESAAIALAGLAALMLLSPGVVKNKKPALPATPVAQTAIVIGYMLLVLSLPVFYRGHNEPGGGFLGGLVASLGLIMIGIISIQDNSVRLSSLARKLIVIGVLCTSLSVIPSLLADKPLWTAIWFTVPVPLLGDIPLGTPVLFDLGVYLAVMGFGAATYAALRRAESDGTFDFRMKKTGLPAATRFLQNTSEPTATQSSEGGS